MDRICQQTVACVLIQQLNRSTTGDAISTSRHQTAIPEIGDAESIRDGIGPHITILRP